MFVTTKLATAAVTGVLSLAVTGAAAFAAFQPTSATSLTAAIDQPGVTAEESERDAKGGRDRDRDNGDRADRIKEILDRLVKAGTITQAQEDTILKAFKEAAERKDEGRHEGVLKRALADLMKLSTGYLGLDKEKLAEQLRAGKSLGEIANTTSGKSREGLIAFDVAQVSAQIDKAVADGKITKEQAETLKKGLVEHVTKFVDHKFDRKPTTAGERKHEKPAAPNVVKPTPTPTPKPTT